MSEINELKQRGDNKVDENVKISRAAHLHNKGRISKLEEALSSLSDQVAELKGEQGDIEDLKADVGNLKRGVKNLWGDFKELQFKCACNKAS